MAGALDATGTFALLLLLADCAAARLLEGVLDGALQLLVRLLLHHLRVLEPVDQHQLLLLHPSHLPLVYHLILRLPLQLVLHLGPGSVLLLNEVLLPLRIGLVLLRPDHTLNLLCPLFLLKFVVHVHFSVHALGVLRVLRLVAFVHHGDRFVLDHSVGVLIPHLLVHRCFFSLFGKQLLLPEKFLLLSFHVAATLAHNVGGTLSSVVDFFDGLN